MRVFNLLGALLFHSIHGVVKLGLFVLNKSLDAVYGKPEIARVAPVAYKVKQGTASEPLRDFPPTVQVAVTGTGPTADAAKAPTNSALEPSDVKPRPRAHLATADRVRTAQLCGPHGIVLGMMWLYLYPEQGIARRVRQNDPAAGLRRRAVSAPGGHSAQLFFLYFLMAFSRSSISSQSPQALFRTASCFSALGRSLDRKSVV